MKTRHCPEMLRLVALVALLACAVSAPLHAFDEDDLVPLTATAQSSPAKVILQWKSTGTPTGYRVRRITEGGTAWTTIADNLPADATSYEDTTVVSGVIYKYQVTRYGDSKYAYVCSGVDVPFQDKPGTVILIVDQSVAAPCAARLERLKKDLICDGYKVIRHDVAKGTGDPHEAVAVKALIQADAAAHADCKTVLLFGRVPIPLSGYENPDGHYFRPMPADTYYADLDGTWTDSSRNIEGKNVPGDGIFDQSTVGTRELMVGRIDMCALDTIGEETDLLNAYLDKDHAFRMAHMEANRKTAHHGSRGFDLNEYRTMIAYVGLDNYVPAGTFWSNLTVLDTVFSVGYKGNAGNIWGEDDAIALRTNDFRVLFTWQGASYHMTYQLNNHNLRRLVASSSYVLSSAYVNGFDSYGMQFEAFSMGVPLGRCMISDPVTGGNHRIASKLYYTVMGDITLRMWMVAPPSHLAVTENAGHAALAWTASPAVDVLGYHVYRADNLDSGFDRLTASPVAGTTYTDTTARPASVVYMVRAVTSERRGTGLYTNLSHGVLAEFSGGSSANQPPVASARSASTDEDTPIQISLTAIDPEGQSLLYSLVQAPRHGKLSGDLDAPIYTPDEHYYGTDTIRFSVYDGLHTSSPALVSITINPVNDAPVAQELSMNAFSLHGKPSEAFAAATDVENSSLSFAIVSPASHGSVTVDANVLRYTPNTGYSGTDSFTYKANDGELDSAPATVSVAVAPQPDLTAGLQAYYPFEDGASATTATDASGNGHEAALLNGAAQELGTGVTGGALCVSGAEGLMEMPSILTPENTYVRNCSAALWFKANDKGNDERYQVLADLNRNTPHFNEGVSVYIRNNVLHVLADGDHFSTTAIENGHWHHVAITLEGSSLPGLSDNRISVYLDGVRLGRTGFQSFYRFLNTSTLSGIGNRSGNAAYADRTYTSTADAWFNGRLDEVRVYDRRLQPSEVYALAQMGSDPSNHAPAIDSLWAEPAAVTLPENTVTLYGVGSDADGDTLTYAWTKASGPGTVTFSNPTSDATNATFSVAGTYSLQLTVSDSHASTSDTVQITVCAAPNATPSADAQSVVVHEDGSVSITLTGSDADGDALTYALTSQPSHGSLTGAAPNLIYTPNANYHGADSFAFKVNDGTVDSAAAPVSITISSVNDTPTITASASSSTITLPAGVTVTAVGSDADGDTLSYAWSAPTGVTFASAGDASTAVTFNAAGMYELQVTVTDGVGTANDSVTITVNAEAPAGDLFDTTDDGLGTVTAQGENGTREGMLKAFDNTKDTKWLDFARDYPATRQSWIQYQYADGQQYTVLKYTVASANDAPARDPRDWELLGSNDNGQTWSVVDARTGVQYDSRKQTQEFTVVTPGAYNAYRLNITSVLSPTVANSVQLSEIELLASTEGDDPTPPPPDPEPEPDALFDTTDDGLGTVTAQGENGTREGMLKAFDNSKDTKWLDFANAYPATRQSWIQYQYADGQQYTVLKYTVASANDAPARDPRDWELLGSNDNGQTWTVVDTQAGVQYDSRKETQEFTVATPGAYNAYRLNITSVLNPASANSVQLSEIQLLAGADTPDQASPPPPAPDPEPETLFDTTDDSLATVTAQGENGTREGMLKAFDNTVDTKWLDFASTYPTTRQSWIQIQYANGQQYMVLKYSIASANDHAERDPCDWQLLGSNDNGQTWAVVDTQTGVQYTNRKQVKEFTVATPGVYSVYRLNITSVLNPATANSVQLSEIELLANP